MNCGRDLAGWIEVLNLPWLDQDAVHKKANNQSERRSDWGRQQPNCVSDLAG